MIFIAVNMDSGSPVGRFEKFRRETKYEVIFGIQDHIPFCLNMCCNH